MPYAHLYTTAEGAVRDGRNREPNNIIGGWNAREDGTIDIHIHQDGGESYMHYLNNYMIELTRGGTDRLKQAALEEIPWGEIEDVLALISSEYLELEEDTLEDLSRVTGMDCSEMFMLVKFTKRAR